MILKQQIQMNTFGKLISGSAATFANRHASRRAGKDHPEYSRDSHAGRRISDLPANAEFAEFNSFLAARFSLLVLKFSHDFCG